MRNIIFTYLTLLTGMIIIPSCSTLEQASLHGFHSGKYKLVNTGDPQLVYVDVREEKIDVYPYSDQINEDVKLQSIPYTDGPDMPVLKFKKQNLDIDITSILLKYRPSVYGLPPQLTTDLNISMYAGWRHDTYKLTNISDPLGKRYLKLSNVGYDFGVFIGPGTTPINSYTTRDKTSNDYSGMIMQAGIAGFLETDLASFGLAAGLDYLLNRHRQIWIYQNKPWVGFIVGIAIN